MQAFRSAGFSNLLLRALNRILFVLGVQLKRSFMVAVPSAQILKSLACERQCEAKVISF